MSTPASIAVQLALALPEAFDYSVVEGASHEDFADLLADYAEAVEQWAGCQRFNNWYDLVDAFAAEFAAVYPNAAGCYVSSREWQTCIDVALSKTPTKPAE